MKYTVGIFSRSDKRDYEWLMELLASSDLSDCVQNVRSTIISNNGFQRFIDDVNKCSLGIIYHTKNRGRINITDIDGSLYDEELNDLNQYLGKDKVIVVIDDVEDSSHEEKTRILELQPSIVTLACDLLLISNTDKKNKETLMTKLKNMTLFTSALQGSSTPRSEHSPSLNTKLIDENLNPWSRKKSPEVSCSSEGHQTWNDYVDVIPLRKCPAPPQNSYEKSKVQFSNIESCNIYESLKISPSIDSLEMGHSSKTENIYEIPDFWNIKDQPKPQLYNDVSKSLYNFGDFEKKPNKEFLEIYDKGYKCYPMSQSDKETSRIRRDSELYDKGYKCYPMSQLDKDTSRIRRDSELYDKGYKCYPMSQLDKVTSSIRHDFENSEKMSTDERPQNQFNNEASEMEYTYKSSESESSLENTEELYDDNDSLYTGVSLDTPLRDRSPRLQYPQKSPKSQPNNTSFDLVIDELKNEEKFKNKRQRHFF